MKPFKITVSPLVSVVIPAYNCAQFLEQTVQSVLDQTYGHFELLIVNDGSTDSTSEIAKKFQDDRIQILERVHSGVAAASNAGILASRGRFVAALGSDDLWLPTKLEEQVRTFQENPNVDFVYCDFLLMNEDGVRLPSIQSVDLETDPIRTVLTTPAPLGSTIVGRRRCFEVAGLFDPMLHVGEDWDLWIRFCLLGFRFKRIAQPLAVARLRRNSLSRRVVHTRDILFILAKLENYRKIHPQKITKALLARAALLSACWMNSVGNSMGALRLLCKGLAYRCVALLHPAFLRELGVAILSAFLPTSFYRRLKTRFGHASSYDVLINQPQTP